MFGKKKQGYILSKRNSAWKEPEAFRRGGVEARLGGGKKRAELGKATHSGGEGGLERRKKKTKEFTLEQRTHLKSGR